MKKLKYSFVAKVTAVFLYAFNIIGAFISGSFIVAAYILQFYKVPIGTYYEMAVYSLFVNGYYFQSQYDNLVSPQYYSIGRAVFNFRHWAIAVCIAASIIAIIIFIFLLCGAGRRHGSQGPVLGYMDHIPLDVTLASIIAIIFALFWILNETILYELPYMLEYTDDIGITIAILSLAVAFSMLLILHFCCTLAARIKVGKWWRGTLVYLIGKSLWRLVSCIGRFFLRLFRSISLVFKAALITSAFLFLHLILSVWAFGGYSSLASFLLAALYFVTFVVSVLAAAQMKQLKKAGEQLSGGNFEYKADTSHMFWDFKNHANNLNSIADGMSTAVEERMRSERLKTELITNVSHDIKTPLTSIVNYVDLLRTAPDRETQGQYLDVLSRQAQRLKKLTVDLVEASKASTGNLPVELIPTNATEILNQALAEYSDKFSTVGLEPILTTPEDPVIVFADGRHLWRVLDNLFGNTVKYALPGTRVYIDLFSSVSAGEAIISVKNISRDKLNVSAQELMERFVRGDPSRHTEGSGLGLSIARSLTELMGGKFDISIDGDLFKAKILLKVPQSQNG